MVAALLAVALLAYGIASEAVLFPYEENKGVASVGRLLSRAYWEIHGTLNIAEMDGGAHNSSYITAAACFHYAVQRVRVQESDFPMHYCILVC